MRYAMLDLMQFVTPKPEKIKKENRGIFYEPAVSSVFLTADDYNYIMERSVLSVKEAAVKSVMAEALSLFNGGFRYKETPPHADAMSLAAAAMIDPYRVKQLTFIRDDEIDVMIDDIIVFLPQAVKTENKCGIGVVFDAVLQALKTVNPPIITEAITVIAVYKGEATLGYTVRTSHNYITLFRKEDVISVVGGL